MHLPGNVLKEICEPAGAVIRTKEFQLGDPTLTTLELWGAEYQESNAILVKDDDAQLLSNLCQRERCPVSFVGEITGDGKVFRSSTYLQLFLLSFPMAGLVLSEPKPNVHHLCMLQVLLIMLIEQCHNLSIYSCLILLTHQN